MATTPGWVTLQLSPLGEQKVQDGSLVCLLRQQLGMENDFPIFVPSVRIDRYGKTEAIHLMEGYVFVPSSLEEDQYYALEGRALINKVMTRKSGYGTRQLEIVPDRHIQELKDKLNKMLTADVVEDLPVQIIGGIYSNLDGKVLCVELDHVLLRIELQSLVVIARLPKTNVKFGE